MAPGAPLNTVAALADAALEVNAVGVKDDPLEPFREGLEEFLQALRVEGQRRPNTLEAYRRDIEQFLAWASAKGVGAWEDLRTKHITDYLKALRTGGKARSSRARALSALRMALVYQKENGRLKENPAKLIRPGARGVHLPTVLKTEQVEDLLAAPQGDGWQAQRDRALLLVLYATGARASEVVGLKREDLHLSLGVATVTGKGNKSRTVPLGPRATESLNRWLEQGRRDVLQRALESTNTKSAKAQPEEVFLTRSGRPMTRIDVFRRVKSAALAAGLQAKGSISPHTLRHSAATHMIKGIKGSVTVNLASVQKLLGHASVKTTLIYTHVDTERLQATHRLSHPHGS